MEQESRVHLKEALLRAALELIAKKGSAGFTFAEAARWAGVSPAAPYRHFRDRDELLADVARRGFEQFAVVLERAWNGGAPEPFAAFERLGKAYLEFARTEPAYYSAMFEAGVPLDISAELTAAGDRAFAVQFVVRVQAGSTEYATLINLTTGTATFTVTRDANNSFSMLIQKMGFSVAELGNTDGIVTLQITGVQLYDATNGLVTMTIITPITGICQ